MNIPIRLIQAIEIVERLQEWIEDRDGLSTVPHAGLYWSPYTMQITIGDVCVFDSEHDPDALSVDECKREWLEHVDLLKPFL